MMVNIMAPGWLGRQNEGGKEEEGAYYGHSQGAYGAGEVAKESLTI